MMSKLGKMLLASKRSRANAAAMGNWFIVNKFTVYINNLVN